MATATRRRARSDANREVDLVGAGEVTSYAPEYLRKLMASDDPPPLHKRRGRYYSTVGELEDWVNRRDGLAS